MKSLYICYCGLRHPLVQAQVLPYLRELVRGGVKVALLTFETQRRETWDASSMAEWRGTLRADGIEWFMSSYHKRPTVPAKLFDIVAGALRATLLVWKLRIDVIHARSHVPAVMGALAKKFTRAKLLFDVRSLLADEYVDAGRWPKDGALYRLTKAVERYLFRTADAFVVLTERGRDELFGMLAREQAHKPFEVIPCCLDLPRFRDVPRVTREELRQRLGVTDKIVAVCAASLGGGYFTQELAEFFAAARECDPRVFPLIVTQSPPELITSHLAANGFGAGQYFIGYVDPAKMPLYLAASDVAVSMVKPTYAKLFSSPTEFAEYLGAGLPVITTRAIGDVDEHVERERVGVLLDGLDAGSYRAAFQSVKRLLTDPGLRARCVDTAYRLYDLQRVGGARYGRLYARIGSDRPLRVLALATYPREAAATRHRVLQFIPPLALRAVGVRFTPFLDSHLFAALYKPRKFLAHLPRLTVRTLLRLGIVFSAMRADVIWVQREAALFGPPVLEWLMTRVLRKPMVLDLDDATHIAYVSPVYGRLATLLKFPAKTHSLVDWSAAVIAGNATIAGYAHSRGARVEVLPTIVDLNVVKPSERRDDAVPIIGWIGTHGTYPLLEEIFGALTRVARDHRFRVRVVGSGRDLITIPNVDVEAKAWSEKEEVADLRSFDIGVYPLIDDAWNAGKSGFKAVQYMAVGIPFVMSPIGVGATMGVAGRTHFLARTEEEWVDALTRLLTDPALRSQMGRVGREYAEAHFSLERQADELAMILRTAADR